MEQLQAIAKTITELDITVNIAELVQKIRTSTVRPAVLATATTALKKVDGIWKPVLVYRWLGVSVNEDNAQQTVLLTDLAGADAAASLHLGHSSCFMQGGLTMPSSLLIPRASKSNRRP
ncbi:hypothetical protein [Desulfopila aestuarii]|nr:hypothetical protein [Desulfopila aestuarii]